MPFQSGEKKIKANTRNFISEQEAIQTHQLLNYMFNIDTLSSRL